MHVPWQGCTLAGGTEGAKVSAFSPQAVSDIVIVPERRWAAVAYQRARSALVPPTIEHRPGGWSAPAPAIRIAASNQVPFLGVMPFIRAGPGPPVLPRAPATLGHRRADDQRVVGRRRVGEHYV